LPLSADVVPLPILAIPPFPRARARSFAKPGGKGGGDWQALLGALARHRVGGAFWGRQLTGHPLLDAQSWPADADPWPLLDGADAVVLPVGDPRAVLALAAGKLLTLLAQMASLSPYNQRRLVRAHLTDWCWTDPFTGDVISSPRGDRALRVLAPAYRLQPWSQSPCSVSLTGSGLPSPRSCGTVANTPFCRGVPDLSPDDRVAVWRSRLSKAQTAALAGRPVLEVEDGFIRSVGLGADCVPPLSIIVDGTGVHFDPNQAERIGKSVAEQRVSA
jgi:capsular polysaccharide export protein